MLLVKKNLPQASQLLNEGGKKTNGKTQRSVGQAEAQTYTADAHSSSHTACRCAKILYICAKPCSVFKDSIALFICLARHSVARSLYPYTEVN